MILQPMALSIITNPMWPQHKLPDYGIRAGLIFVLVCCFSSTFVYAKEPAHHEANGDAPLAATPVDQYRVVNRFPHDPQAFTQGLLYVDGGLYESTGLYGQSSVRKVDLETGVVRRQVNLPKQLFGEGLALWDNKLVQLTWRSGIALVFSKTSFKFEKQFRYRTEGWGLTHNSRTLIMSDGSAHLYFLNPETFEVQRQLTVTDRGKAITYLNELEYIKGEIYANVWQTTRIARISPETGQVLSWIDLSELAKLYQNKQDGNVLNGIAYDDQGDRLFVTGKRWPHLFEIKLVR